MFNLLQIRARAHRAPRKDEHTFRASGRYKVLINEGLIGEEVFDNHTDALLYAKDQVCVTNAPIQMIDTHTMRIRHIQ